MNAIQSLERAVLSALPKTNAILRRPRDPAGQWWFDAKLGSAIVTVSWSPGEPFIVSMNDGAAEPCDSLDKATGMVIRLLSPG